MKSEWITKPLGELTSYMSKGIPPKYSDAENNTTIRVLNQKCNRDFKITYEYSRLHDLSKKSVPKEKLLRAGDVLINSTGAGTAGRVAQLFEVPCLTTIDGHMILLRPTSEIETYYYGYAIKSFQNQIELLAEGSTGQTEINRKRLCDEIEIAFPIDLDLQRQISSILFAIDEKITTNKLINENLEQQAQAIFKSWFVDFEPFGGIMPDDWKERTLDSICDLIAKGITPKYTENSDQLVINQKCVRNHQIDLSLARPHIPKKINEKWLKYGDVLVNSTGTGTLGRAAQVLFIPNNLTVDSHVSIIRASKQEYVYFLGLWATSHEHDFEMLQTGSTGQTDLPRERLKQMQIILPSESILSSFSDVIKPIADIRIQKQQESQRLSLLRDTLLPKLMNGEIDVSHVRI